ncbi:hypothetical protein B6A27_02480 [Anoxybacillus sp. UARK-01]|nr:hypothetical protein B6A27_02480 [Anoxybacillus sp. UARK-01]
MVSDTIGLFVVLVLYKYQRTLSTKIRSRKKSHRPVSGTPKPTNKPLPDKFIYLEAVLLGCPIIPIGSSLVRMGQMLMYQDVSIIVVEHNAYLASWGSHVYFLGMLSIMEVGEFYLKLKKSLSSCIEVGL